MDVSEDSASDALRVLRSAGLVVRRAEGRMGGHRLRDGNSERPSSPRGDGVRTVAGLHPERSIGDEG